MIEYATCESKRSFKVDGLFIPNKQSINPCKAKLFDQTGHGLTRKMSPYILTQLALNYLQSDGIIPTLENLQKNTQQTEFLDMKLGFESQIGDFKVCGAKSRLYEDCAATGMSNIDHLTSKDDFLAMTYGFFSYICDFKPMGQSINSSNGQKEPKKTISTQLVVSHPFQHSNPINIAAQVGDSDFLIFQNACEAGKIKILQEVSNPVCFPTLKSEERISPFDCNGLALLLNPLVGVNINRKQLISIPLSSFTDNHSRYLKSEEINLL